MKTVEDNGFVRDQAIIQARSRVRQAISHKPTVEWVMTQIAAGAKLRNIARSLDVDYSLFHRMLREKHGDDLAAARSAHAEEVVAKNLELADDIQEGLIEAKAGTAAANIRQWYVERAAPDEWGKQSSVNVNHKGVIGLHLEAIQQLSHIPLEGEVEDAEYEEMPDEPEEQDEGPEADQDPEDHPLL